MKNNLNIDYYNIINTITSLQENKQELSSFSVADLKIVEIFACPFFSAINVCVRLFHITYKVKKGSKHSNSKFTSITTIFIKSIYGEFNESTSKRWLDTSYCLKNIWWVWCLKLPCLSSGLGWTFKLKAINEKRPDPLVLDKYNIAVS